MCPEGENRSHCSHFQASFLGDSGVRNFRLQRRKRSLLPYVDATL
jgi:hypothetical protein